MNVYNGKKSTKDFTGSTIGLKKSEKVYIELADMKSFQPFVSQQRKHTSYHSSEHLKMANFMSFVFTPIKNR